MGGPALRALASAAALTVMACARVEAPGLAPLSMAPQQGTPDAALDVEIAGRGFAPAVEADYGDASASTVAVEFAARLLPAAGGPGIALEAVALTPRGTLTARVPAGLSTGSYDLLVVDPLGREGALRDAFRVVTAAENVASFRFGPIEAQAAGIPFRVAITAVDSGGRTVEGFSGDVDLLDETGTVVPAIVGPFALGRASALVTVTAISATDRLTVRDAAGNAGSSNPFEVSAGPATRIVFTAGPTSAGVGACAGPFEVEVQDALGHPAPPSAVLSLRLDAAPAGALAFHVDPACGTAAATVDVAPGSARAAFRIRAAVPGSATIRVVPATLPSAERQVVCSP